MRQNESTEKKITFRNELQEMINRGLAEAVRAGTRNVERTCNRLQKDRVERLLYARNGLDILIASLEEELAAACEAPPVSMSYEKTDNKVVHLLPSGQALGLPGRPEDIRALLLRNRLAVKRIDRAVQALCADPYYEIIELKYRQGLPEETIAEQLCCDPSTIRRNKNRLLERLGVILFGIDALEM